MTRIRKDVMALLVTSILIWIGATAAQPALALTVSGLAVSLDCTSLSYPAYSLTTNRNNTGGAPGSEAEAFDIVVTDGAGMVLHQVSNTLAFGTYPDGPGSGTYNVSTSPQYNPIIYTWTSRAGNGLRSQLVYSTTGTCAGLPTYNPPDSNETDNDEEVQFEPGDDRLNRSTKDRAAPVAIYCMEWGIEVRLIDYATGIGIDPPAITVLYEDIDAAGIPDDAPIVLGEGNTATLYRLTTGEFQVSILYPNEYKWYIFVWDQCPGATRKYTLGA